MNANNRQTLFNILISIVLLVTICGGGGLFLMNNSRGSNPAPVGPTVSVVDAAYTQAAAINNGQTATAVVNNALSAGGPTATSTLEPHEVIETNIALTFAAQTGIPTQTATIPAPSSTPTAYLLLVNSPTPGPRATATTVVASDAVTVYNQVVALCQGGAPYVTIGMITVPCTGNVLPAPTSNDVIVNASAHQPDLSGMDTSCPSNREMFADHGWGTNGVKAVKDGINVAWEGCGKWQVQAVGIGTFRLHLVIGYQYTVTKANGVVAVYYGDGSWINVWGSTIRYLPSYTSPDQAWVHDALILMIREYNYGYSMDPRYGTINGNLDVPEWTQPSINMTCPTNTIEAAAILGGDDYKYWTEPDWSGGAWVFNSKGDGFHHFTHPGEGYFVVWTAENGAVSVYPEDAGLLEQKNFEEGSFHCSQ